MQVFIMSRIKLIHLGSAFASNHIIHFLQTCPPFRWDTPILVAWGISDKYLPQSEAEDFQKGNPSTVKLKLIEGAGHMPQEDW